jgi:histidinol-phosphate phosphatase family protein
VSPITGIFGTLPTPLAFGVLRLATEGRPDQETAVALIRRALDGGVRILDTADVYGQDDRERHFGDRLVRDAIRDWSGPRAEVRVVAKVGLRRPGGRWTPDNRAESLRSGVEGSLRALGVERLFCLLLHARDARVPFETVLATLAGFQREGLVEHLGLANVTPAELRQAQRHFAVVAIQNELSLVSRGSASDGTLELTRRLGIPLLAHRPLGGHAKVSKLASNRVLTPLAARHGVTPHEIALAALWEAGEHVIPLVGATRPASIDSSLHAAGLKLDVSDRTALVIKYSFAAAPDALAFDPSSLNANSATSAAASGSAPDIGDMTVSATPRSITLAEASAPSQDDEVLLIMGIQGAGKSSLVNAHLEQGYERLNRDLLGGKLDDLAPRLRDLLLAGKRRVALDNTYPTRISRAPILAVARSAGVPVRCQFLDTPLPQAQWNITLRHLERYGRPLGPDEQKAFGKSDPNLPPPMALARWLSSFEPPSFDEGFARIEFIPFVRRPNPAHQTIGLLLDVDGTIRKTRSGELYPRHPDDIELLPGRRQRLEPLVRDGVKLFFVSNQSGVASGKVSLQAVQACFLRTAELLGLPVAEIAFCPHPAFPVGCFCRKPGPGLGVYLIERHGLDLRRLTMVGDMDSDAEFARGLGIPYADAATFFGG